MIVIVYHRRDMDGITSGAIARHYFKNKGVAFKELPFDYNDKFPIESIEEGSELYFMDVVCQPYSFMKELNEKFKLTVIDHHKTFIDDPASEGIAGLRTEKWSGCILTWTYFYPKLPLPKLVYYLGQFDAWHRDNWEEWNNASVPSNFGALAQNVHPSIKRPGIPTDNFLDKYLDDYFAGNKEALAATETRIIEVGQQIWTYQFLEYSQTAEKAAIEAIVTIPAPPGVKQIGERLRAVVINSRLNSFGFDSVFNPERHDCMISWYMGKTPGIYEVSLYSPRKEIDLSALAVAMGGGGHAGACGFQASKVNFFRNPDDGQLRILFENKPEEIKEPKPLPAVDPTEDPTPVLEERASESIIPDWLF